MSKFKLIWANASILLTLKIIRKQLFQKKDCNKTNIWRVFKPPSWLADYFNPRVIFVNMALIGLIRLIALFFPVELD